MAPESTSRRGDPRGLRYSNGQPYFVRNVRITYPELHLELLNLQHIIREVHEVNRVPGLQIVVDMLLHSFQRLSREEKLEAIANYRTPITGYPFSTHVNPGSFAPKNPKVVSEVADPDEEC